MMSLFLRFRSSSLQRLYYEHLTQRFFRYILFFDMAIIANIIYTVIYLSFCYKNQEGVFCLIERKNLFFAIVGAVWLPIFISTSLYLRLKRQTYSDLLLLVSYFYFLSMSTDLLTNGDLAAGLSYILTIMNLLFMSFYRALLIRVLHILGNMTFFAVFFSVFNIKDSTVVLFEIIGFSVYMAMMLYLMEKNERTIFYNNFSFEREKKAFNDLLDNLPQGLAIVSKGLKEVFVNESMKTLFDETETDKVLSRLLKETKKKVVGPSLDPNNAISSSDFFNEIKKCDGVQTNELTVEMILQQFLKRLAERNSEIKDLKKKKECHTGLEIESFAKSVFSIDNAKWSSGFLRMETFSAEFEGKNLFLKIQPIRFNCKENILIIVNDMSETVKVRALEEANEYKNNLFASFSHEFKTPLNYLFSMLHGISQNPSIPEIIKTSLVKPAFFNTEILLSLVNAVSDYSLLSLGKLRIERKIFNIRDFFEKSIECLRYQAENKGLIVDLVLHKDLPEELRTDPRRLQQILFQLYSNSIKFTYTGKIEVKVKLHKILKPGIQISVKDTGIGIAEKDRIRLNAILNEQDHFVSKAKISSHSIGASLGLTVSQQIAKLLGFPKEKGLQFKCLSGTGTKFWFVVKDNQKEKDYFRDSGSKILTLTNQRNQNEYDSPLMFQNSKEKEELSCESMPQEYEFGTSAHLNMMKHATFSNGKSGLNSYDSTDQLGRPFFEEKSPSFVGLEDKSYPKLNQKENAFFSKETTFCEHAPVLIVDDDEFNILALSSILNLKGVKSKAARNGQLALDLMKLEHENRESCCKGFKMVFMDLNMPVLNGIETTKEAKKMMRKGQLHETPIIAFTAFETEIEKNECFKTGMVEYLTKPVDIQSLGKLLERFLGSDNEKKPQRKISCFD